MSVPVVPNPFEDFIVGHGVEISFQTSDYTIAGGWAAKDISGARWTYRVRAYDAADDTSLLFDEELTKSSESASGGVRHYLALGTTVRAKLDWYIAEVDNDNADANTSTGQREKVVLRWREAIRDVPLTVPA